MTPSETAPFIRQRQSRKLTWIERWVRKLVEVKPPLLRVAIVLAGVAFLCCFSGVLVSLVVGYWKPPDWVRLLVLTLLPFSLFELWFLLMYLALYVLPSSWNKHFSKAVRRRAKSRIKIFKGLQSIKEGDKALIVSYVIGKEVIVSDIEATVSNLINMAPSIPILVFSFVAWKMGFLALRTFPHELLTSPTFPYKLLFFGMLAPIILLVLAVNLRLEERKRVTAIILLPAALATILVCLLSLLREDNWRTSFQMTIASHPALTAILEGTYVFPVVLMLAAPLGVLINLYRSTQLRRFAEARLVDSTVTTLQRIQEYSRGCYEAKSREKLLESIEDVAACLDSDFTTFVDCDRAEDQTFFNSLASKAETIRKLKGWVVLPRQSTRADLSVIFAQLLLLVVRGDLGAFNCGGTLRSPLQTTKKKTAWTHIRSAIYVLPGALVVPALVGLVYKSEVLKSEPALLGSAWIFALVWFVTFLLSELDPRLTERFDLVSKGLQLIRGGKKE